MVEDVFTRKEAQRECVKITFSKRQFLVVIDIIKLKRLYVRKMLLGVCLSQCCVSFMRLLDRQDENEFSRSMRFTKRTVTGSQ